MIEIFIFVENTFFSGVLFYFPPQKKGLGQTSIWLSDQSGSMANLLLAHVTGWVCVCAPAYQEASPSLSAPLAQLISTFINAGPRQAHVSTC